MLLVGALNPEGPGYASNGVLCPLPSLPRPHRAVKHVVPGAAAHKALTVHVGVPQVTQAPP